ncbi:MAG: hypothetical protein R3E32_23490 [Chitinophagales bacterium]
MSYQIVPAINHGDCDTQDSAISHSQLYIKVTNGFDFEIDDNVVNYIAVQKMLFELHKLVKDSDIISVKKPSIQLTSEANGIYVFEFENVNDINILMQQVQNLHFIDYVRKVPIK